MSFREHAHELIERLPESQVSALVGLLETMIDPANVSIRNAPIDDEPVTEEEERAVAASRAWFEKNPDGIPFEDVVADLGFTMDQVRGKDAA